MTAAGSRDAAARMNPWVGAGAILRKDLLAEWRNRELLSAMVVFAVVVVLVFNFALELSVTLARQSAVGFYWVTLVFAAMLGLNRSLAREQEGGCLDGLLLCPVSRGIIFLGKAAGNVLVILLVALLMLPLFTVLFGVSFFHPVFLLVVVAGGVGLAGVGTLLSAVAVHSRARDVMLPITMLPVCVPLMLAAVRACRLIVEGRPPADYLPWAAMLLALDTALVTISYLVFDYVVEE